MHQLGVSADHHQQIVEIVGHASCQSPDGIHLVRHLQLRFQPPAFADIAVIRNKMTDLSVGITQGRNRFFGNISFSIFFLVYYDALVDLSR